MICQSELSLAKISMQRYAFCHDAAALLFMLLHGNLGATGRENTIIGSPVDGAGKVLLGLRCRQAGPPRSRGTDDGTVDMEVRFSAAIMHFRVPRCPASKTACVRTRQFGAGARGG